MKSKHAVPLSRYFCSFVFAASLASAASTCTTYPAPSGTGEYLICIPTGVPAPAGLVVFAHGYVAPDAPLVVPADQLTLQGVSIPDLVTGLGFAFAAPSYSKNGLAIKEGIAAVEEIVWFYKEHYSTPSQVYLVGASEGGLVTAKSMESPGTVFNGGLALCGPVGDFRKQINHFGDFRVIFDYYFPTLLAPYSTAVWIPPQVMANWNTEAALIAQAIDERAFAAAQLFSVTKTPSPDGGQAETALAVLWYNIFATDDAHQELGGQPYDNRLRWYSGSQNDFVLNLRVRRFSADKDAIREIEKHYQTTGQLVVPLVTMHTTGDPVVPYWHEPLYNIKVLAAGSFANHVNLPIVRYGHCSFQPAEVLFGFGLLVTMATGQPLANPMSVLPTPEAREQYLQLERSFSAQ